MKYLFSSESVTKGHPDKVADSISDAILDEVLRLDPNARVAVETAVKADLVLIFGEITTNSKINYEAIARKTIKEIGYDNKKLGFDAETVEIIVKISTQSPDIAMGVDNNNYLEQGAGDQGLMFGYAANETKELMPLAIDLAHKLALRLTEVREKNIIQGLRPDGKTQVTVEYENNVPVRVDTIVISTQHDENHTQNTLKPLLIEHVIKNVISNNLIDDKTKILINPTGQFIIGGPVADAGLTGRKIIVDTYGGYARHGGGAFSGKDPSKVDRSAAYMARYLAKHIVAAKLASRVEIQLAYAIGVSQPVSIFIDCFGTEKVAIEKIYEVIKNNFDLRPAAIIEKLNLKQAIYKNTSSYGHFGREDVDFPWEKLNDIDIFNKIV